MGEGFYKTGGDATKSWKVFKNNNAKINYYFALIITLSQITDCGKHLTEIFIKGWLLQTL